VLAVNGEPVQVWNDLRWSLMQAIVDHRAVTLDVTAADNPQASYSVQLPVNGISTDELETDFLGKLGLQVARPLPLLGKVIPDGPAQRAGLQEGDLIVAIDGQAVSDGLALVEAIQHAPGQRLALDVRRNGQALALHITPEPVEQKGQVIGRIKVEVPMMPEMVSAGVNPLAALVKGAVKTWDTSIMTLKMVGKTIVGEVSWKNVTGPITIADYAGQTARIGLVS